MPKTFIKDGRSKSKKICLFCKKEFIGRQWRKFCCLECSTLWGKDHGKNKKENNGMWTGGRGFTREGYYYIYAPDHPRSSKGYIKEHRFVMEQHIGRILEPHELIHHKNGIKTDNRIENLEIMEWGEHSRLHNTKKNQDKS